MNEVERAIQFGKWLTGHDEDTIWQMYEDYSKGERRTLSVLAADRVDAASNPDHRTCDFCHWTNVPSNLNIGEVGSPLWICHGCVKNLYERAAKTSTV